MGILRNKDVTNTLITMRTMLLNMRGADAEAHRRLDGLMNYMIRVFGNAVTRTELAVANRNSGSAMFLLFTEHREDTYLASTYVIQNGFFEEKRNATYVMVRGPVALELTFDGVSDWSVTLDENGTMSMRLPDTDEILDDLEYIPFYMERIGNVSVAAIPEDLAIRAQWKAVSDGAVEVIQASCGVRASQQYPGSAAGKMKVRAGDTGTAFFPEQADGILPDGFHEETFHASDLTRFLGISLAFVSWRLMVTGMFLLVGLAVFLVISLASLLLPNKTKKGAAFWCLLALFCVAVVEAEGAYWMLADMHAVLFAWKAVAGAAILAMFFLRRNQGKETSIGVFPGLAAIVLADLTAVWSFLPGIVLFLLGHILLAVSFLRKKPISRASWAQWAVLSVLVSGLVILVLVPEMGPLGWEAAVCTPVFLLMATARTAKAFGSVTRPVCSWLQTCCWVLICSFGMNPWRTSCTSRCTVFP